MKKLKIGYFGTPDFAAHVLEKIFIDDEIPVEIDFVVTQEDKKAGRKQVVTPSAVKIIAQKHNIPVFHLSNLREDQLNSLDLVLLYAFGEIIPKKLLERPKYGFWNIHPSLLPKYRGPSPVAFALMKGEIETGVTLMKMNEKLDEGPIIAQEKLKVNPTDSRGQLTLRLSELGLQLFKGVITATQDLSRLKMQEQDSSKATYSKLLSKKDGFIEISNLKFLISNQIPNTKSQKFKTAEQIFNMFRGLHPWPGIWTLLRLKATEGQALEKRLKIVDMDLIDGQVIIKKVQLEGKQEVDFQTFNSAYNVF